MKFSGKRCCLALHLFEMDTDPDRIGRPRMPIRIRQNYAYQSISGSTNIHDRADASSLPKIYCAWPTQFVIPSYIVALSIDAAV